MNNLNLTKSTCRLLVEARPQKGVLSWNPKTIFFTISPNPNLKHTCLVLGEKLKIKYGDMEQRFQYEYCMKIIKKVIWHADHKDTYIVGTWELNKDGNVHLHFLIDAPTIRDETSIQIFRRDVSNITEVLQNRPKGKKYSKDFMCNIVFINKDIIDIANYMDKDYKMNITHFLNYTTGGTKAKLFFKEEEKKEHRQLLVRKPVKNPNIRYFSLDDEINWDRNHILL